MIPRLSINQKPNGQHLRITVEHKPQQIPQLVKIQGYVQEQLSEFIAKDPPYIHLTLLHIGIPQDIYFECRRINPSLTHDTFMDGFMGLLQRLHQHINSGNTATDVQSRGLNLYGSAKSPAVALSIERNPQLDHLHLEVFNILARYVEDHVTLDVMDFMLGSPNFRHCPPHVFDPHITLGRIPAKIDQLPTVDTLSLTIKQPYLAHVTVI